MAPTPRQGAVVGLLAILPVIGYTVGTGETFAAVAAGNVVLIVGSLRSLVGEHVTVEGESAAKHS